MTDFTSLSPFENCLYNLCFPYDGFSEKNLKQQVDSKKYLLGSLNYVGTLLKALPRRSTGPVEAANRTLVSGNINDLLLAFHATSAGYYVQARNLMRPILESANLIRLFCQDPKKVDSWIAGGKQGSKDLSPATVRAVLYGNDPDPMEEFYSFLCEAGAHPRFTGARSYVVRERSEYEGDAHVPQLTAFIGGKRLYPLHTVTLFTCLFMTCVIISALFAAYPALIEVDEETMFTSFNNILKFVQDHLPDSDRKKDILDMMTNLKKLKN